MNAGDFAKRRARIYNQRQHHGKDYQAKAFAALIRQAGAIIVIAGGKVVGWRMTNGQMVCRKRRYPSGELAALSLADIQAFPRTGHVPIRGYECPHCKGWHLTHEPPETRH